MVNIDEARLVANSSSPFQQSLRLSICGTLNMLNVKRLRNKFGTHFQGNSEAKFSRRRFPSLYDSTKGDDYPMCGRILIFEWRPMCYKHFIPTEPCAPPCLQS